MTTEELQLASLRPEYHGPKLPKIFVNQSGWHWLQSVAHAAKAETPNICSHLWGTPIFMDNSLPDGKAVLMEKDRYGDYRVVRVLAIGSLAEQPPE